MWFSFSSDLEKAITRLEGLVSQQSQDIKALTARMDRYIPSPALVAAVARVAAGAQANDDLIDDKPI